jgi:hypothetical protein
MRVDVDLSHRDLEAELDALYCAPARTWRRDAACAGFRSERA